MTDWLLLQLAAFGVPLLGLGTFLSCLALPIPASLMMLSAGAFVASGDLSMVGVGGAAFAGAMGGDQLGYWTARRAGERVIPRLTRKPKIAKLHRKAAQFTARWGGIGIFLSRWLLSPLGPYANLAAGAVNLPWSHFTFAGALGEALWVTIYVGLGFAFAANIDMVAEMAGDFSGALAAGAVTLGLGVMMIRALRDKRGRRVRT